MFSADLILTKKVAAIHDLSGLGRCSLTVITPVLSSMGIQVCPLPTALLSSHTGGYSGYTFLDLTEEMKKIAAHWKSLNVDFDSIYTGFLGSAAQIELVLDFCNYYRNKCNSFILADPVMGDDGEKYATYTDEMCRMTSSLVKNADLITPNLTEACILAKTEYREDFTYSEMKDLLTALTDLGSKRTVITGIKNKEENKIGCVYFDKTQKLYGEVFSPYIDKFYPGTGDIFASVLLGEMLNGLCLEDACKQSVEFVYKAVKYTSGLATPEREGLAIEALGCLLHSNKTDFQPE